VETVEALVRIDTTVLCPLLTLKLKADDQLRFTRKAMAGYSNTPLVSKLGIKPGFTVAFVNAPKQLPQELRSLPADVTIARKPIKQLDFAILFALSQRVLARDFPKLARKLLPTGMLWVAWPKKSSGVSTDLSFASVQEIGLAGGLVDVKICAIDEVWSALKFVYRLRDRPATRQR
jgi:hypothetical protein